MRKKASLDIRKWRRSLGLRQAWLAKQTGISRWKISRWESGKLELSETDAAAIEAAIRGVVQRRASAGEALPWDFGTVPTESARRAKALAEVRRAYAITQADLAHEVGTTTDVISLIENGYAEETSEEFAKWEEALTALVKKKSGIDIGDRTPVPISVLGGPRSDKVTYKGALQIKDETIQRQERLIEVQERLIKAQDTLSSKLEELIQEYSKGRDVILSENSELAKSLEDQKARVKELSELLGLETDAYIARQKADDFREKFTVPVKGDE